MIPIQISCGEQNSEKQDLLKYLLAKTWRQQQKDIPLHLCSKKLSHMKVCQKYFKYKVVNLQELKIRTVSASRKQSMHLKTYNTTVQKFDDGASSSFSESQNSIDDSPSIAVAQSFTNSTCPQIMKSFLVNNKNRLLVEDTNLPVQMLIDAGMLLGQRHAENFTIIINNYAEYLIVELKFNAQLSTMT